MREIDTGALSQVAPSLGVGNPATATTPVTFDDDVLQQSYDVGPQISRARALEIAPSGGQFVFQTQTLFAGGGAQNDTSAFSYIMLNAAAGTTVLLSNGLNLPREELRRHDLWIHWMSMFKTASADPGHVVNAEVNLSWGDSARANQNAQAAPNVDRAQRLEVFNSTTNNTVLTADGRVLSRLNLRMPLDSSAFAALSVTVAVDDDCTVVWMLGCEITANGARPTGSL